MRNITKREQSHYKEKSNKDWLKVKCLQRQEFVIGGWTEPKGSRGYFGALLVGVYAGGELLYAGKVGTGFGEEALRRISGRLRKLERPDSPFADFGRRGRRPVAVHWVEPELVCEVTFTEWTDEGQLRHPAFQGLREDKSPTEVVHERPAPLPAGTRAAVAAPREETAPPAPAPAVPKRAPAATRTTRGKQETELAGVRL